MNFSIGKLVKRLDVIIKPLFEFIQLGQLLTELILQSLALVMLVSDVIYKLLIVLRCPGWSIQRTYIMDLLACASYVVAQILKLLFNRFGNCFILIIQFITLVD